MKELVEIIAKALVDNPDEVVVTETEKDKALVVNLKVAPSDMGKVIGKQTLLSKAAFRGCLFCYLYIHLCQNGEFKWKIC